MDVEDGSLNKRGEAYCACRYLACGRKFKSLKSLEQHLISYHNITWEAYARYSPSRHHETVEETMDDQLLGKRKDAYCMCTYMECGRKFKMLKSLEEHVTLYHNISWQLYTQYYHRSVRKPGGEETVTVKSKSPKTEKKDIPTVFPSVKSPKSTSPRGSGGWYSGDSDSGSYGPASGGMSVTPPVPASPVVSFMPPTSTPYIPTQYSYMAAQVPLVPTIIQYQPMLTPPMLGYPQASALPLSPGYYGQFPTMPEHSSWMPPKQHQHQHHQPQSDSGILNLSCPKASKSTEKENSSRENIEHREKSHSTGSFSGSSFSSASYTSSRYPRYANDIDLSNDPVDHNMHKERRSSSKPETARKSFPDTSKGVIVIEPDDQFEEKLSRNPQYMPKSIYQSDNSTTQQRDQRYLNHNWPPINVPNEHASNIKTSTPETKAYKFHEYSPHSKATSSNKEEEIYRRKDPYLEKTVDELYNYCLKYSRSERGVTHSESTARKAVDSDVRIEQSMSDIKTSVCMKPQKESNTFRDSSPSEPSPSKMLLLPANRDSGSEEKQLVKPSVLNTLAPVDYSNLKANDLSNKLYKPPAASRRMARSASLPNLTTIADEEDEIVPSFPKPLCIDLTDDDLQSQKNKPREDVKITKSKISKKRKSRRTGKDNKRGKPNRCPRGSHNNINKNRVKPHLATQRQCYWGEIWWTSHVTNRLKRKYILSYRRKCKRLRKALKGHPKCKQGLVNTKRNTKTNLGNEGSSKHHHNVKYLFGFECDSFDEATDINESESNISALEKITPPGPPSKKLRMSDVSPIVISPHPVSVQTPTAQEHLGNEISRRGGGNSGDSSFSNKCISTPIMKFKSHILPSVCYDFGKVQCLKELADVRFRCLAHSISDKKSLSDYIKSFGIPLEDFDIHSPVVSQGSKEGKRKMADPSKPASFLLPDINPSNEETGANGRVQYHRRLPRFVCTKEVTSGVLLNCEECEPETLLSGVNYLKHRFEFHSAMKCKLCEKRCIGKSHSYRYQATLVRHLMIDHGLTTALDPKAWMEQNSYAGIDLDGLPALEDLDRIMVISDDKIYFDDAIVSYQLRYGYWVRDGATGGDQEVLPSISSGGHMRPVSGYPDVLIHVTDFQGGFKEKVVHRKEKGAFELPSKLKSKSRNVSSSL